MSSWADRGDVQSSHRTPSGAMRHPLMLATFLVGVLLATPGRSEGVGLLFGNVLAGNGGAKPPAPRMLHVRGAEIVDGKGRPVLAARGRVRQRGLGERALAAAAPRRDRLPARRRDGDERRPLLHELSDVRGRRGAGQVPRRRLAVAGRQHRLGQAPRRLPDPEHARAARRLPVAGQRQGALGSPRDAGTLPRAVDGDRAPLQG